MQRPIVRYMTVGEPVIIGVRPKPPVEEPPPKEVDDEPEESVEEPEPEPEPLRGIDQETLDKIYAEIEEIERKSELTTETLREAEESKAQADELRKLADELHAQAEELHSQAEQHVADAKVESEHLLADAKAEADKIIADAQDEAYKILADAQAQADKLIADTQHEAEELLKTTRKEGYDTGYADGTADGRTAPPKLNATLPTPFAKPTPRRRRPFKTPRSKRPSTSFARKMMSSKSSCRRLTRFCRNTSLTCRKLSCPLCARRFVMCATKRKSKFTSSPTVTIWF